MLLADKPAGMTSHDVVLAARRAFGESRVGHAGTLDPFATGLLVLLFGRATRLIPHLDGSPKVYEATIAFGAETDTDDLLGAIVREAPAPPDDAIAAALPALTGLIEQMPPAYSAKRVGGRRAYAAAREGTPLELAAVTVDVHSWTVLGREGDALGVRISCGGGTYIRALARDLGRLTGSAAHLSALRRTRSGAFEVRNAVSLPDLQSGMATLQPARAALPTLSATKLDGDDAERVLRGMSVPREATATQRTALIDRRSSALLAYAEADGANWQPRVVMRKVDA